MDSIFNTFWVRGSENHWNPEKQPKIAGKLAIVTTESTLPHVERLSQTAGFLWFFLCPVRDSLRSSLQVRYVVRSRFVPGSLQRHGWLFFAVFTTCGWLCMWGSVHEGMADTVRQDPRYESLKIRFEVHDVDDMSQTYNEETLQFQKGSGDWTWIQEPHLPLMHASS